MYVVMIFWGLHSETSIFLAPKNGGFPTLKSPNFQGQTAVSLPAGNDHTSVVPEDWTGWLPPHPEEQLRAATANSKSNRQEGNDVGKYGCFLKMDGLCENQKTTHPHRRAQSLQQTASTYVTRAPLRVVHIILHSL